MNHINKQKLAETLSAVDKVIFDFKDKGLSFSDLELCNTSQQLGSSVTTLSLTFRLLKRLPAQFLDFSFDVTLSLVIQRFWCNRRIYHYLCLVKSLRQTNGSHLRFGVNVNNSTK